MRHLTYLKNVISLNRGSGVFTSLVTHVAFLTSNISNSGMACIVTVSLLFWFCLPDVFLGCCVTHTAVSVNFPTYIHPAYYISYCR